MTLLKKKKRQVFYSGPVLQMTKLRQEEFTSLAQDPYKKMAKCQM